jgi:Glu-tRNA(Gln) amidotransferase subunit E-like FAD-binding protein
MYPDTDSPPSRITAERVAAIRARLRPAPWERLERYGSWGVPEETTRFLIRRGGADTLDEIVARTGVDGRTAAIVLGQRTRALHRAGVPVERLGTAEWVQVFDLYTDGKLPRECIAPVATAMARHPGLDAAQAAESLGIAPLPREQWSVELRDLRTGGDLVRTTRRGSAVRRRDPARLGRHLTGVAVRQLAGRAPASEVAGFVREGLAESAGGTVGQEVAR